MPYGASKHISDHHPKSSILASAYHDALLLPIFFHFHVYVIENVPFKTRGTYRFFYTDVLNIIFANRVHMLAI